MTASTKDLIERLRFMSVVNHFQAQQTMAEAADALERLTQPVGVEPVAFMFKVKTGGTKRPVLSEFAAIDYLETGDAEVRDKSPLYSSETVARLIAELDVLQSNQSNLEATHRLTLREVQAETMRLQTANDALQKQVKDLRGAALRVFMWLDPDIPGTPDSPIEQLRQTLVATEPKGEKEE